MMHPHTELKWIDEIIGYGVIATQFIPKGTIVWILDNLDQKLDQTHIDSLDELRKKEVMKYSYRDQEGKYILCWDLGRFVNHSSNPTCLPTAYDFEIAGRDIYPGEELTDDYGSLNLDEPFECLRQEEGFRTKIMPDDILTMYQEWDNKVIGAMTYFNEVEQPLKHLISPQNHEKLSEFLLGKRKLDSYLNCYYKKTN
ncbi:MAG: SET domain-containing protein [Microcoleaceae cyanobacterium]